MNPLEIIGLINDAMRVAALLIQAGKDAAPMAEVLYQDLFGSTPVTAEQGAAVKQKIADLEAQALAPIDPPEPDEL